LRQPDWRDLKEPDFLKKLFVRFISQNIIKKPKYKKKTAQGGGGGVGQSGASELTIPWLVSY
jgi:hypothetical protein